MTEIHCHNCGGFIGDERPLFYERLDDSRMALPTSTLCDCAQPVVYGPSATRNSATRNSMDGMLALVR